MGLIAKVLADGEVEHVWTRLWGHALDGTKRLMVVRYDAADRELVSRLTWYVREHPGGDWYAERSGRGYVTMHRLIMGDPPADGLRIGHLNGDGLDNRRANLHWMTQSEILAKRRPSGGMSKYKGVAWDSYHDRWVVRFRGKKLGTFASEEDAARAFDAAALAEWGEMAYRNFA